MVSNRRAGCLRNWISGDALRDAKLAMRVSYLRTAVAVFFFRLGQNEWSLQSTENQLLRFSPAVFVIPTVLHGAINASCGS